MQRKLIPIKAAPSFQLDGAGSSSSSSSSQAPDVFKRRRVGVAIACNACRRRKVRCNGERPRCSACQSSHEPCVYRDVQLGDEGKRTVLEVVRLLSDIPEREAMRKLEMLKSEADAESILSMLRRDLPGDETASFGFDPVATADAHLFATAELEAQNPVAFPHLDPIDTSVLEHSVFPSLNRPAGSFSRLVLSKPSFLNVPSANLGNDQGVEALDWHPRRDELPSTNEESRTMPAPTLCDPRLSNLSIEFWTNVPISSELAAQVISLYLETDHPLLGHFDPELFISDLVSHKSDYCSSLLVNSLLYWACQMYGAIDRRTTKFATLFCREAENQWPIGSQRDTILRMAAAEFLSLAYLGQGRDHAHLKYLGEAANIGLRMGLFGVERSRITAEIGKMSPAAASSYMHAAWGVFNWITFSAIFYRQPGIEAVRCPPSLPIPRSENPEHGQGTGGFPHGSLPQWPSYMGHTFPHACEFWRIVHEVCLAYYANGPGSGDPTPSYFAEFKLRELLAWSNSLPPEMCRDKSTRHHVLILHIWLHAAIMDIFRPLISSPEKKDKRLRTFSSADSSPDAIFDASLQQLQRLVLVYRINYRSSTYTILWHTALVYVANAMLSEPERHESWLSYLMLCIYGYEGLRRSWRVADVITRALLSMMLRNRSISTDLARDILANFQTAGDPAGDEPAFGEMRATFMADMEMAMSHPEAATVEKQADQLEEIASLMDYTTLLEDQDEM